MPLSMSTSGYSIDVPGYAAPKGRRTTSSADLVDAGYFAALRLPVISGRPLLASDDERAPDVAVVSQAFAERFWPRQNALGKTFKLDSARTVTVVGITRGYPNMMSSTIVMSRDTLRMLGQADTGPRVGPLMIKLRDPAQAAVVAAQLNRLGDGQWKAWTRQEQAHANAGAMFEEGILVIIIGGCVVLGTIIGVTITWQTLRGAIMANIKEFASLRALGVGMGSLNRIVMELSFWVGLVGVAAAILLTWLVSILAMANAVIIALPPVLLIIVGGGLIVISMLSGLLSLGILKKSQPADLLR
jgi:putative ABC transport system permease protein